MSHLTSQMRAIIRAATQAQMTDTCTIEKEIDAVGQFGQPIHGWVVVGASIPCRLITSKGATLPQTDVYADRVTLEDTYTIALPVGTDLAADYRITAGSTVWRVASVVDGRTDAADVQAVLLRMRQE